MRIETSWVGNKMLKIEIESWVGYRKEFVSEKLEAEALICDLEETICELKELIKRQSE